MSEGVSEGVRDRVEPTILIFNPVILFCDSCHPSLLFLLQAPIIPIIPVIFPPKSTSS